MSYSHFESDTATENINNVHPYGNIGDPISYGYSGKIGEPFFSGPFYSKSTNDYWENYETQNHRTQSRFAHFFNKKKNN